VSSKQLGQLAFFHHLAIGGNTHLEEAVDLLTCLARAGLIEFVPREDAMVGWMVAMRRDVDLRDYCEQAFVRHLEARACIVRRTPLASSNRIVFEYVRPA